MFLSCLVSMIILIMGYEYSRAQPKAQIPSSKIGVVNIFKILRQCKRSAVYQTEKRVEQSKQFAELKELSKKLKDQEDVLGAFKQDSSDYLAQREDYIKTNTTLEARQAFFKEQDVLTNFKFSKTLYQDILRITHEIAEQKGLDAVFEKIEPDFSKLKLNEYQEVLRTQKLLYSAGCVDITDDVMARLDKVE